tara:strand:+ start:1232 stop:1513 length:282 start_codon:yes stop_codon:yes gene_type:complete
MSNYVIKKYSRIQAKRLGVQIKPAENKAKKIDVYKGGKKVATIGANGMNDYPTYIQKKGLEFANERKRLYKIRFQKSRKKVGSNSYWADQLLW